MNNENSNLTISLFNGVNEHIQLLLFKSFNFNRSILSPTATLDFTVSKLGLGLDPFDITVSEVVKYLKVGSMVRARLDGVVIFTGYITELNPSSSAESDSLNVKCKDVIWRLTSTTLNHMRPGISGKMPFSAIVDWALDGLKIINDKGLPGDFGSDEWFNENLTIFLGINPSVLNVTTKPSTKDLKTELAGIKAQDVKPKAGESIYEYLKRLIRPWGYILQSDELGNIIFYRPNTQDKPFHSFSNLLNSNPQNGAVLMFNASISESIEGLHSHYYVFSNAVTNKQTGSKVHYALVNSMYPEFAPMNQRVVYNEELKSKAECEKFAKRTMGFEIADYWKYQFDTYGFKNIVLYWNDIVVDVRDELNGVSESVYVIGVSFEGDADKQYTSFECCKREALLLE